jgi:hypothetical protein
MLWLAAAPRCSWCLGLEVTTHAACALDQAGGQALSNDGAVALAFQLGFVHGWRSGPGPFQSTGVRSRQVDRLDHTAVDVTVDVTNGK